jgi:hypothetical protein
MWRPDPGERRARPTRQDREPFGDLLLSVDGGRLFSLEVHSYDDLLPMPRPEHVHWEDAESVSADAVATRPWSQRTRHPLR